MLDLVLEPKGGFLHADLTNRKATIHFKDAVEADPSAEPPVLASPAVEATGVFDLVSTCTSIDASITARCSLASETEIASPSAIKVSLVADATKNVAFAKGELTVDTGIAWQDSAGAALPVPTITPSALTVTATKAAGASVFTLKLTRVSSTVSEKVDVTFTGVEVATGVGRDANCNGKFSLKPVGEVHVDALSSWCRCSGTKPNPTHFSIRALDPHTVVRTLGVSDGE